MPGDYYYDQVVTLNPFETIGVACADWSPTTAGNYTVEATMSRAPQDDNMVNNTIKFDVFVSSTSALIVTGNNGGGKVSELEGLLKGRGHQVRVVDANDASIADVSNSTLYVVGDVANTSALSQAVDHGNYLAFVNDDVAHVVANADKVFSVERTKEYDVNNVTLGMPIVAVEKRAPRSTEPMTLEYTNKADLLKYVSEEGQKASDIEMVRVSDNVIAAERQVAESMIPAVVKSPYGDLKYFAENNTGIIYVVPEVNNGPVETVAASFSLEQNYPNPFNPTTTIGYTLAEDAQVTLRVLDLLGKEVATLVSGSKSAGSYTVNFNGTDNAGNIVPSGTYVYRIDVSNANGEVFSTTRKMTLSK
jgi:hypothetical protein